MSQGDARRRMRAFLALTALVLGGCVAPAAPADEGWRSVHDAAADALGAQVATGTPVRFTTTHGNITMVFYDALLPQTTAHIIGLAEDGFYDGTLVHRVVDDFVIQGGDRSGTGQLGSGDTVPMERDERLVFGAGAVGLARDLDPDSGDSQWFITEKPAPHLHDPQGTTGAVFGAYALFGQVVEGMATVQAIAAEPVVPGADRPIRDVTLLAASVVPWPAGLDARAVAQTYHEGVGTPFGPATVQTPLYPVEGQRTTLAVLLEEDAGASTLQGWLEDTRAGRMDVVFTRAGADASTYEASVTFPHAGGWRLGFGDEEALPVRVLSHAAS